MSAGKNGVRPVGYVNAVNDSSQSEGNMYVIVKIDSEEVWGLIDPGSTISVCHPSVYRNISSANRPVVRAHNGQIRVADGGLVNVQGRVNLTMILGNCKDFHMDFAIADVDAPIVLGLDFLRQNRGVLDVCNETLSLDGCNFPCVTDDEFPSVFRVTAAETVIVPPNSEMVLPGKMADKPNFVTGLFEANSSFVEKKPLFLAKMVAHTSTGRVPLRVINPTDEPQVIYKGQVAAMCEAAGKICEDNIDENNSVKLDAGTSTDSEAVPEHLQPLLNSCTDNLTPEQIKRVRHTLCKYSAAFAKSKYDLGQTDLVQHRINTGDATPVKQTPHRMAITKRAAAKEEVERMYQQGIIEPSASPWSSNIVLVSKKQIPQQPEHPKQPEQPKQWRFCLDYRLVNNLTIKDSYPLPRIDDSLDALRNSKWYTVCDLQSGFFQCLIHPDDREKTAFTVPGGGLWQFKVLPMGMSNSPATFERLMEKVMSGLDHNILLIYLDDLIIHGKSFSEHMDHLETVLSRLIQANLKVSPKKCQLLQLEVVFLGHIVSGEGLAPCKDKLSAVQDWPQPCNVTQIRSFLGLCSYYRRFIKGFAEIARPLHKLTGKGVPFLWSDECEQAMKTLKIALTTPPVLSYPQEQAEFILDTDASGQSLGAVLSQIQEPIDPTSKSPSEERVIAYYSKAFSKQERNYCVTRRELLAIVDSVKHFHHYLYGRPVTIRTDHGALRWLLNFKNPEGQMACWLEVLGTYDLKIVHRSGTSHNNADAMSRRPCGECKHCVTQELREVEGQKKEPPRCAAIRQSTRDAGPEPWVTAWTDAELIEWQNEDHCLKKIVQWMESEQKPPWSVMRSEGSQMRTYWSMWSQLRLKRGILHVQDVSSERGPLRLIAPLKIRQIILEHLHNNRTAAHLGMTKTLEKVRHRFWWPGLKQDVHRWCRYCPPCQKRNLRAGRKKANLHHDPVGSPMEKIGIDILSFREETEDGNTCVLVIVDYFTKWTEAIPLPSHTALNVADALVTEVFTRFGVPRIIHSDQGAEFQSQLMTELYHLLEIRKTRTTPFHPSSDGLVENFNRTLINMLSKFCQTNKTNWDHHLPYLLCAYRSSIHESTGCSPNLLMLGREINLPVDLMYSISGERGPPCPITYVEWVRQAMEENFERVREALKISASRQKRYFDQRAELRVFKPGDWVVRYYPPALIKSKLNSPYIGPYLVVKKFGEVTYQIQKDPKSKPIVVHIDDLKAYHDLSNQLNWVMQGAHSENIGANTSAAPTPHDDPIGADVSATTTLNQSTNRPSSLTDTTTSPMKSVGEEALSASISLDPIGSISLDPIGTSSSASSTHGNIDESVKDAFVELDINLTNDFQPLSHIPPLSDDLTLEDCLPVAPPNTHRRSKRTRLLPSKFKDFVL